MVHVPDRKKSASRPLKLAARRRSDPSQPHDDRQSDSSLPSATESNFLSTDAEAVSAESEATEASSDSELSSSSEEPSDLSDDDSDSEDNNDASEVDDDSDIVTLRPGAKPDIQRPGQVGKSSLLSRLRDFMPQMAAANQELEKEREAGTLHNRDLENIEDGGGPIIEMNLGLGVLEEKSSDIKLRKDDDQSESGSQSEDDVPQGSDPAHETDVLSKLMGKKYSDRSAHIRELSNG